MFSSPVDSEKSLSPLVDNTRPYTVPFRPYDWNTYPSPTLRPPLVQHSLHQVELDGAPTAIEFYSDRSAQSSLYAERTLGEDAYDDYRRHAAALLFPNEGLHAKSHRAKAQSELLCSSLLLNGTYTCVKCTKVKMEVPKPLII